MQNILSLRDKDLYISLLILGESLLGLSSALGRCRGRRNCRAQGSQECTKFELMKNLYLSHCIYVYVCY